MEDLWVTRQPSRAYCFVLTFHCPTSPANMEPPHSSADSTCPVTLWMAHTFHTRLEQLGCLGTRRTRVAQSRSPDAMATCAPLAVMAGELETFRTQTKNLQQATVFRAVSNARASASGSHRPPNYERPTHQGLLTAAVCCFVNVTTSGPYPLV